MLTSLPMIRIAVCGTGFWAEEVHLPVYAAHERFEVVGVQGRNLERARELAAKFGGQAFDSFDEMLASVDAVSFALPPEIQARLSTQAAAAGKALMLEKPMATSLAEAQALVDAVKKAGVGAMVYLPRLYSDPIRGLIRQAAEAGVTEGSASFRSSALLAGSPYADSVWRQGAFGALWDIGPHVLSVLCSVFGPVRTVSASNPQPSKFECVFEHDRGRSTASLNLRDAEVEGLHEQYSFWGPAGRIDSSDLKQDRLAFFNSAVGRFAECFDNRRSDLGFAHEMVAVLDAARRSVQTGNPEAVILQGGE